MNNLANLLQMIQLTIQGSLCYFMYLTILLVMVWLLFRFSHGYIGVLGIIPRHVLGLPGIIFSPFIHANFNHLFFNLIPLLILSIMLMFYGFGFYWQMTWILIVASGFLIWLFGRPGIHVGASALITAYWGFLVIDAFFHSNSILNLAIGLICIYYFFGIFLGIFPTEDKVSWEGHLLGLLAGLGVYLLAYFIPFFHQILVESPYWIKVPMDFSCSK